MTGLLAGISGHFSRKLMLGTVLPVVVFVLFLQASIAPLRLQDWRLLGTLAELEPSWRLAATTLLTVVAAGLLYALNNPLIRLYEGYPWRASRFGRRRAHWYRDQLETGQVREKLLRRLRGALRERDRSDPRLESLRAWEADLGREVFGAYPRPHLVLPTKLGNVIRSFEDYPERQFRMAGVTMWPRLVAKIPKDHALIIDDAKARFDLMLNSSFLTLLLALAVLADGLLRPAPFAAAALFLWWLAEIATYLLIAVLFYQGSVARAAAWGRTVMSAFELHRLDLLESLGFRQKPANLVEERLLWLELRYQMEFGDPAGKPPNLTYTDPAPPAGNPPTFARGDLGIDSCEISRGIEPQADGSIKVFVQLKNVDSETRDARDVVVVDTVPDGFDYRWQSAQLGGQPVAVSGINPYRFSAGNLAHDEQATLVYHVVATEPTRRIPHEGKQEMV